MPLCKQSAEVQLPASIKVRMTVLRQIETSDIRRFRPSAIPAIAMMTWMMHNIEL